MRSARASRDIVPKPLKAATGRFLRHARAAPPLAIIITTYFAHTAGGACTAKSYRDGQSRAGAASRRSR